MPLHGDPPLKIELFSFYGDAPQPKPASSSINGSLPSRALQLCPPVAAASGHGWYTFPPLDFAVRWDGQLSEWSLLEENEPTAWRSLAGGFDATLPGAMDALAEVPERFQADLEIFDAFRGQYPFINADPRAGNVLEIVTGVIARTSPGWCVLARGVPNWPSTGDFQVLEGVIESDWYRSWIPTMVRLLTPNKIVRFHRSQPLMTLQPIPRTVLEAGTKTSATVAWGLDNFPDDVWREFVDQRQTRQDEAAPGGYRRLQKRMATRRRHSASERHDPDVRV